MPVATEVGKISVKTETSPSSTISSGSRKRPLSSGDRASNPTWQQNINETRLHIGGLGRPRSRFSSVRSSIQAHIFHIERTDIGCVTAKF